MSQEFYPRKVFCCSCLASYINELFNVDVREYSRILKAILYNKKIPKPQNSAWTEQKQSRIIVCSYHLERFFGRENKYQCASKSEGGFWFEEIDRGYCYNCIKHYLKEMTKNCSYKIFIE